MRHTPEKKITVNKIGGSNMSQLNQVLNLVKFLQENGESPVLVVSAFHGVTDALIEALDQLDGQDYTLADIEHAMTPVLEIIKQKISEFIKSDTHKQKAIDHLQREYQLCVEILITHKAVTTTLSPSQQTWPTRDKIIAFGERTVIGILEAFLSANDIQATAINDITYFKNGKSKPSKSELHEGIQRGIADKLQGHITEIHDRILIIGGHITNVGNGMVIEIGRSYTDTTAVDTTAALKNLLNTDVAATVAWKDVDGIMSSDPRQLDPAINRAIRHPDISLDEAMEMAGANSTVMQVDSLALAKEVEIPLVLKNIQKPDEDGTTFHVEEVTTNLPFKIVMANRLEDTISCKIPQMATQSGFAAALTEAFAKNGISLNDIITSSTTIDFTINLPPDKADRDELRKRIRKTLQQIRRLEINGEIHVCKSQWRKEHQANLVIIGNEMRNTAGILSNITGVLAALGINIEMASQTAAQRQISFHIDHKDALRAVQALHRVFLDKDKKYVQKEITPRMTANTERFLR